MKKVLFITGVLLCLLSVISCSPETIEDIQQEEQVQKDLENINIYARDTGHDEVGDTTDDDDEEDGL